MFMQRLPEFLGNHAMLAFGFGALTLALVYTQISRYTRGFRGVNPAQLTRLMNQHNALLIDISPTADFEKGHIAGAKHVAMSQFDPENKVLAKARDLPVAVCCRSGPTSYQAARRLVRAGFSNVYVLDGGMAAWRQAELPMVEGRA